MISLLRQFARFYSDKRQITVGFIGYPNTGKSSVINTLRMKKVCDVAPIPGETKVWKYITLTKHIYLVDCPGVVTPSQTDSTTDIILRCVARVENIIDPEDYIQPLIDKIGRNAFYLTYDVEDWENAEELLDRIANKMGKLLKGGEPNLSAAAKIILNDWSRGNIPYYTEPPPDPDTNDPADGKHAGEPDNNTDGDKTS